MIVLGFQNPRTYTRCFAQKLARLAVALKKDRVAKRKGKGANSEESILGKCF